MTVSLLHCFEC